MITINMGPHIHTLHHLALHCTTLSYCGTLPGIALDCVTYIHTIVFVYTSKTKQVHTKHSQVCMDVGEMLAAEKHFLVQVCIRPDPLEEKLPEFLGKTRSC